MKNRFISKKIRLLALILASFTIATLPLSSIACAKKDEDTKTEANQTTTAPEGSTEAGTDIDPKLKELNDYVLPEMNCNNEDFNVLIRGQADEWDSQDIVSAEETGEPVPDAVYRRNAETEEKFKVKIVGKYALVDQQLAMLRKAVNAGDSTYDAVMLNFESASTAAKTSLLSDLKTTPNINLTKPWWDQSLMAETSVMNKTYYATGDISIMDNDGTWTMMFNKKLLAELGLPSIYDMVLKGEWTIDKFTELSKGVTRDVDGNGTIDHLDRVGFATTVDSIFGLFFSTGMRIIKKDDQDMPYFALTGDTVMTNLQKIYDVFRGPDNITMVSGDYAKVDPKTHLIVQAAFEEDRALFYGEVMQCVIRLRQMNTEFGIIPMPKADIAQTTYNTNIHRWASATAAIPTSCKDLERSGLIVEALAWGGMKHLTPAYYDICLKSKFSRDTESSEMLDIIFAGRSADLGYVDKVGNLLDQIVGDINTKKNTFASTIEKKSAQVEKDIGKIVSAYETLQ